jgi:glucan endo-1,3-alpha-glucosidase
MAPPEGERAVGAMRYRSMLKDASCEGDPLGKPSGWEAAVDAVNYAIVLPAGASGMQIRTSSGETELQTVDVVGGLNYG